MRHSGHFAQSLPVRVGAGRFPRFRAGAAAPAGFFSSPDMPGIYAQDIIGVGRRQLVTSPPARRWSNRALWWNNASLVR
jgi:hypothetical protein